nr:MAG TPA: hypothetical protein [Caudoviricetes sp.]DAI83621.1 MAG TPA: hypothetical protein [Caudoviricetes sp.]
MLWRRSFRTVASALLVPSANKTLHFAVSPTCI